MMVEFKKEPLSSYIFRVSEFIKSNSHSLTYKSNKQFEKVRLKPDSITQYLSNSPIIWTAALGLFC